MERLVSGLCCSHDMLFTSTSLKVFFTLGSRIHKLITEVGACSTSKRQLTLKRFSFFVWQTQTAWLSCLKLTFSWALFTCLIIDIMQLSCNFFHLLQSNYSSNKMQTVSFLIRLKTIIQKSSSKHKDFKATVRTGFLAELVTRLNLRSSSTWQICIEVGKASWTQLLWHILIVKKVLHQEALLIVTLIFIKQNNHNLAVSAFEYCSIACNEVQNQGYTYL